MQLKDPRIQWSLVVSSKLSQFQKTNFRHTQWDAMWSDSLTYGDDSWPICALIDTHSSSQISGMMHHVLCTNHKIFQSLRKTRKWPRKWSEIPSNNTSMEANQKRRHRYRSRVTQCVCVCVCVCICVMKVFGCKSTYQPNFAGPASPSSAFSKI